MNGALVAPYLRLMSEQALQRKQDLRDCESTTIIGEEFNGEAH